MGNIKVTNIKNQTYYFFNVMINIANFDPNLLKIDKKSYKILIFITWHISLWKILTIQKLKVNHLYFIISKVDGHFECNSIKEKNGNKYLILNSANKNKEVFKKVRRTLE